MFLCYSDPLKPGVFVFPQNGSQALAQGCSTHRRHRRAHERQHQHLTMATQPKGLNVSSCSSFRHGVCIKLPPATGAREPKWRCMYGHTHHKRCKSEIAERATAVSPSSNETMNCGEAEKATDPALVAPPTSNKALWGHRFHPKACRQCHPSLSVQEVDAERATT